MLALSFYLLLQEKIYYEVRLPSFRELNHLVGSKLSCHNRPTLLALTFNLLLQEKIYYEVSLPSFRE